MAQTQSAFSVNQEFWPFCLECLARELPAQQFKLWIKPLTGTCAGDGSEPCLTLVAPSYFALDMVRGRYLRRIGELGAEYYGAPLDIELRMAPPDKARANRPASSGPRPAGDESMDARTVPPRESISPVTASGSGDGRSGDGGVPALAPRTDRKPRDGGAAYEKTRLNPDFTFDTLVTGRANDLARAAAMQVAQNPGTSYNPLFIYGGVGLGKTHLIHAIGNAAARANPRAQVRYVHVEDYYSDMVRAIQRNTLDAFKGEYRRLDVLLIDDIQFFNNKPRTQDEFFHVFNALTETKKQIVITCDTYPKDIQGLEDRLISRFDWGLTVQIEVPELEMRVAILRKKAEVLGLGIDEDVAFLIAKNLHSNVRELEGALNKVVAYARFHNRVVSLDLAKEALKDLLNAHNRQLSIEHIQKTVADYYKIKITDMHSKRKPRVIVRPRQVAMWLAKELTAMSLPSIGEAFGGRDHTTVLHACRTITELRQGDHQLNHDLHVLTQVLRG
jgi:chromosomal replication initiator protein